MLLAYIGPGLGVGLVAVVVGTSAALGMLAVGVVWYPLKRLFAQLRSRR
jgi:hypothetical protein